MNDTELVLEFPEEKHQAQYEDLMHEWSQAKKTPSSPSKLFFGNSFGEFLAEAQADVLERGDGKVPAHLFLLVAKSTGRILGAIQIRHRINHPMLQAWGGHIGYGIRPGERGKGHGNQILRLALPEAKKIGIPSLLVSCDEDNIASAKVIEKNGGRFDGMVPTEE